MSGVPFAGDVGGDGVPIPGELVHLEAVQPTAEQVETERRNKISRTDAQAFSGTIVVTIVVWILRLNGVDLNPLPGQEDIPAEVGAAWGGIITVLAARWMNRAR